jgi:ABC-type uncharacterized transport system fused permease/ATPase subunit
VPCSTSVAAQSLPAPSRFSCAGCIADAILDECTSAVSDDVTDKIYETCASLGITLFTIAHQKTVLKHHQLVLRFDGKGSWKLGPEDILVA